MEKEQIKEKLVRFYQLWNESLNGDYKNQIELSNLAQEIGDLKLSDNFLKFSLSASERTAYKYAVLLANYK